MGKQSIRMRYRGHKNNWPEAACADTPNQANPVSMNLNQSRTQNKLTSQLKGCAFVPRGGETRAFEISYGMI